MDNTLGKIPCFLRLSRKVIGCSSHVGGNGGPTLSRK